MKYFSHIYNVCHSNNTGTPDPLISSYMPWLSSLTSQEQTLHIMRALNPVLLYEHTMALVCLVLSLLIAIFLTGSASV